MKILYKNDSDMVKQLIKQDSYLEALFQTPNEIEIELQDKYFVALVSTILFQQLSGNVAQIIYNRLKSFCQNDITKTKILEASNEELRELGLSFRKIEYIKSLATNVNTKAVNLDIIDSLSDEEVIDMLVLVKGIGRWTAEMFLIFSLGRKNIFSSLDLGLRNGVKKLYRQELTLEEIEKISQKWNPYKTIVSLFLWRFQQK
ncbi:MAG: DNA-3-methyladenine glycosylase 2 family protein [Firmicutes bacterium]|nr:DNA-3-methyladenine glycosylase 2 family protein [Bacillota bacterium]